MKRILFSLALIAALAAQASAEVLTASIVSVSNTSVAALSNYVTQDVHLANSTRWLNSQILLTLTSGSIYQDQFGGNVNPNSALVGVFPSLAYDTFVSSGSVSESGNDPSIIGGAVNLGGASASTFTSAAIDVAWGSNTSTVIGDLDLARITLSKTANGTFKFLANTVGTSVNTVFTGTVTNGVISLIPVPEPATFAMLGIAGLGMLFVRKRK